MKKNNLNKNHIVKFLCFSFLVFSCSNKSSGGNNVDRGTGWKLNSDQTKFNSKYKGQKTPQGTVFIEGGTFTMGKTQDDIMHDWNNTPNQQNIQSFYMDEVEVTNSMYLYYLNYLKKVYPPDMDGFENIYKGALPDTLVWRNRLGYTDIMTENYLRHRSFANYPVVGVNWIQANEFAEWRTDRVVEKELHDHGFIKKNAIYDSLGPNKSFSSRTYLNEPSSVYNGNVELLTSNKRVSRRDRQSGVSPKTYIKRESGIIPPRFRLPTEAEWEYAAKGKQDLRKYNLYRGRKKYPWDSKYTKSNKRRTLGDQLANFKQRKGDYGGIAGWSSDGGDITTEVKSFPPNDFGLYDMAGNVSEWVADVYRPIVDDEFNDFNYYRGNVYYKNSINSEGKVLVLGANETIFDTLSNGKIIARVLPGEILREPEEDNDIHLRPNYYRADNRNFRDGDYTSSRHFRRLNRLSDPRKETKGMYNSPEHKVIIDEEEEKIIVEHDKNNLRTTLINDEVRIYKGGSWKDRAYWLDPAQRRSLPQFMATDFIGFRCAVSRVGSRSLSKKKRKN